MPPKPILAVERGGGGGGGGGYPQHNLRGGGGYDPRGYPPRGYDQGQGQGLGRGGYGGGGYAQIDTPTSQHVPPSETKVVFSIIVLTKNRPASLQRLLHSIQATDYGNDTVSVNIRIDGTNYETQRVAETFEWPHKTVTRTRAGGLRAAWLGAWTKPKGHAIILEDDVELSPAWYGWLAKAWKTYGDRDDLAGSSLNRQTLVPQKPSKTMEIVNDHQPFLYKLVGSIGFSPHPKRWQEFLEWVATKDLDTFDAHVEGLVTSDWYKTLDKKSMWTQLFLRFCEERGLYTMYVNLPEGKTLAAHWREKGEHFRGGEGRDFALATTAKGAFPTELVKYGWDGRRLVVPGTSPLAAPNDATRSRSACWDLYQSNVDATKSTEFVPGKSVMMEPSSVKMLCGLLTPTTRVLEWGSGGSTLFFSRFVASWDSIEHDSQWYKEMMGYTASMDNVRIHTAPHSWKQKDDGTYAEFKDYVEVPAKWGRKFDVVIVDGRARVPCARSVVRNSLLASNGVVVVHDWERTQYKPLLDQFQLVQEDTADARHLGVLRPLGVRPQPTGLRYTGTEYGGWMYNATGLTPNSVVYSVGLGEDTSWDEAMMRDHGLQLWGFDPTPKAIEYVQLNPALGDNFHFTAEGLAAKQGRITFTKPSNPDHVSMRQGKHKGLGETIVVPVNTLDHLMQANGHTRIDVLKIDIEGSEYEVLEDWIARNWFPMDQLLVEFHQRLFKDASRHIRVLEGLKANGFRIIHNVKDQELTFQRRASGSHASVAPSTFDFDHGSMVVPTKRLETVLDKLESSGSGRQVHREGRRAFQVGTGEVRD
ncbi:hypothetical protein ScalyP_jg1492 [Parmales sp. scaly parma]|nr:hypothetical protein ScalyP_jg1492 [Parmales sp. scaly parma]